MSEPVELRFSLDTAELAALAWGDPGDPVALLVHGFPDSAWTWSELGPALAAAGWYVVAPFTRGYAPSSLAYDDDYSIGSLVGDIIALHRALGADERAVLIGHDWGGAIVSATSSSHPELFARTVVIGIPPLAVIADLLDPRNIRRNAAVIVRQLPRSWYMSVVSTPFSEYLGGPLIRLLWRLWAPGVDLSATRELGLRALGTRARRRAAFSYYRAVWNPLYRRTRGFETEQRAAFTPMRHRTLLIQGRDDTCGLARTSARALDHLPGGSVREVVPDAGHFAHLEQPEAVAALVLGYLGKGADA
ncbi:alpha/beta fold hydrolase [Nocardia cyriacigeorgica]|uniref:alpha/beta fold hydrolase n=1 Tax=Nocardia cyriacigeorgica TaxID=135487 RepID=UPI0013D23811|nr:alpha/beta hydrolase [Nocardia cyriacigeorgica]NEW27201.1 alpha/beta hydrolase [Nocardia cyriacigeorgica]